MRHIVLDTETTGFDFQRDRLVEIGAVELVNNHPTGQTYHQYINPGIPVPQSAVDVHGLTNDFLKDYPPLDPAPLRAFLQDSPIIAHNAAFDAGFLSAVLGPLPNPIIDTLAMARAKYPGQPASLDALCRRFGISTAQRTKHGALLDAELLAAVYAELIVEQVNMDLVAPVAKQQCTTIGTRPVALPTRLTAAELEAHAAMVAGLNNAMWLAYNYE